jgi:hypothetical protein
MAARLPAPRRSKRACKNQPRSSKTVAPVGDTVRGDGVPAARWAECLRLRPTPPTVPTRPPVARGFRVRKLFEVSVSLPRQRVITYRRNPLAALPTGCSACSTLRKSRLDRVFGTHFRYNPHNPQRSLRRFGLRRGDRREIQSKSVTSGDIWDICAASQKTDRRKRCKINRLRLMPGNRRHFTMGWINLLIPGLSLPKRTFGRA